MKTILRLLCMFLLFLPLCRPQLSQTPAVQQPAEVIDGAKEPDRIADSVAWFMLFTLLAGGPNPFPRETRAAFLKDTGLSQDQISRVMLAADEVTEEIRRMEERVNGSALNLKARTATLQSERDALVHIAVNDLLVHRVDYDGGENLKRHLNQRIKRAITIRNFPAAAFAGTSAVFAASDNYNNVVATAITDTKYQMGGACVAHGTAKIISPDGRVAQVSASGKNTVSVNAMLHIDNDAGRYVTGNIDPTASCPVAVLTRSRAGIDHAGEK